MPALPATSAMTGSTVTEAQAKQWLSDVRDYLNGLLGADGLPATARSALGVSTAVPVTSLTANTTLSATTHYGRAIHVDANAITVTLPTIAAAGAGWWCWISLGSGTSCSIARAGGGSELIFAAGDPSGSGSASISLPSGSVLNPALVNATSVLLMCDGTHWRVRAHDASHGSQLYVANGTWVAPRGVTLVMLTGSGGGGGGGDTYLAEGSPTAGGPGGAGGKRWRNFVAVVPGTTYTITIGAGGAGGSGGVGTGGAGGATSFGALVTIAGGAGGPSGGGAGAAGASDSVYPTFGGPNSGAGGVGSPGTAGSAGSPGFLLIEW